jgi:porphobilinogen deaminase
VFTVDEVIPSPGQGALGIQVRSNDAALVSVVAAIDDPDSSGAVSLERAFLARLGAGCSMPVGAYARREHDGYLLEMYLANPASGQSVRAFARNATVATAEEKADWLPQGFGDGTN